MQSTKTVFVRVHRFLREIAAIMVVCCATLGLIVVAPVPAVAQAEGLAGAATIGAIKQMLQDLITKMTNSGVILIGDANGAGNATLGHAHQLLREFEQRTVGRQMTDLVRTLDIQTQSLAAQAQLLAANIDAIMTRQQACAVINAEHIAAALTSTVEGAKEGIPLLDPRGGYLTHFVFEQHPLARNMVPEEGGRVIVHGRRLWNDNLSPRVQLLNQSGEVIDTDLALSRGSSDHNFAVQISPDIVRQHRGRCLHLKVQARETKRFAGIRIGERTLPEATLPLCIPRSFGMMLALDGAVHFRIPELQTRTLGAKSQSFRNGDWDHWAPIDHSFNFEPEVRALGDGWAIIDKSYQLHDRARETRISGISHTAYTVRVTGSLQDAEDVKVPPLGPRVKLQDANVRIEVTPIVAKSVENTVTVPVAVLEVPLQNGRGRLCRRFNVPGNATQISTYEFRLRNRHSDQEDFATLFHTNRVQAAAQGGAIGPTTVGGLQIRGTYNPAAVAGEGEICMEVQVVPACGTFQQLASAGWEGIFNQPRPATVRSTKRLGSLPSGAK